MKETIIEAFYFRHACKEFDPNKKIPEETFDIILETARLSPSSFGFEPWRLLVVQDPELREQLRTHTWGGQKQIPTSSHMMVLMARREHDLRYDAAHLTDFMHRVKQLEGEALEKRRALYEGFQRNDFNLLDDEGAIFEWACRQTYIMLGNMMTAAALLGIDTCPIEGFHRRSLERVLTEAFGVNPRQWGISCMLTFGYRVTPPPEKTRQPLNELVTWFE